MENSITIIGTVRDYPAYSHEFEGSHYYVCTVATGYMRGKPARFAESLIRLYIPEEIAVPADLRPSEDRILRIEGELVNSIHEGHKDVSVTVDSITEVGSDEGIHSYARLTGVITRVFTTEANFVNFVNFLVSAYDDRGKRSVSLRVVAWGKLAQYIFGSLKIGDTVTVTGGISSSVYDPSKEKSGIDTSEKVYISELYCYACSKVPNTK